MKNKYIIPLLALAFVSVLSITIGFAALNTELSISGEAYVRPDYDTRITGLTFKGTEDQGLEKYKYKFTKNSITLFASLPTQNSSITYEIDIKNNTNKDYGITNITGLQSNLEYTIENYNLYDMLCTNKECNNGNTDKILLTIKYKDNGFKSDTIDYAVNLDFKFAYGIDIKYLGFSDISKFPKSFLPGGNVNVNLPSNIVGVMVVKDNKFILANQGYTLNNGILKIPSVKDSLIIANNTATGFVNDGLIMSVLEDSPKSEKSYGLMPNVSGNYGKNIIYGETLTYDNDNNLVLGNDDSIAELSIDNYDISSEYSVYMTLKASTSQSGYPTGAYAATALAISRANSEYLTWFGFNKNYFNIHSYYIGTAMTKTTDYETAGFASFDVSEYSNKITNIQITATKTGNTNVYFDGKLVKTFQSGGTDVAYTSIILGELRKGRGLKMSGTIYDVALYNRALTSDEVLQNYLYAKQNWNIE